MGITDERTSKPNRRDFLARALGLGALLSNRGRLVGQERLPTRPIPGTGESLPVVGFGSSKSVLEIPTEGTEPIVDVMRTMLQHGGRVVDTSWRTEDIDREFGRVLQNPEFRDRLFLTAKINTARGEQDGIDQWRQTQRLFGRRTVDLLQVESLRGLDVHWPNLRAWKDAGEARYIGVTVSANRNQVPLEAFMRASSPDFVHVNYSPMESGAEDRVLPLARDMGMAVLINRPFMNGTYFGRVEGKELPAWAAEFDCETWAQFSLKYVLANPAVTCVLTETTNPEHMEENIQAAFGRFPDEPTRVRMRELLRSF
jgi:diketogulonate reductase-like aldo/keto reductase